MTEKSEQLSETLTRLRMPGLRRTFPERVRMAAEQGLSYEDFLLGCLQDEVTSRQDNDLKRRLKEARFPVIKSFDQFDFSAQPVLPRENCCPWAMGIGWTVGKTCCWSGRWERERAISPRLWEWK